MVNQAIPERDPVVEKCTGDNPRSMLCFVSSLKEGQRRTEPVHWDCIAHPPQ